MQEEMHDKRTVVFGQICYKRGIEAMNVKRKGNGQLSEKRHDNEQQKKEMMIEQN